MWKLLRVEAMWWWGCIARQVADAAASLAEDVDRASETQRFARVLSTKQFARRSPTSIRVKVIGCPLHELFNVEPMLAQASFSIFQSM